MPSDMIDKQKSSIEQRNVAEKLRIEDRYDKQIESLKQRKERELEAVDRRAAAELRRLSSVNIEKPRLN